MIESDDNTSQGDVIAMFTILPAFICFYTLDVNYQNGQYREFQRALRTVRTRSLHDDMDRIKWNSLIAHVNSI